MTNNQFFQALYARLNGKPEGFPEPLLIARANEVIKTLIKNLLLTGNPLANLFIREVAITSSTTFTVTASNSSGDLLLTKTNHGLVDDDLLAFTSTESLPGNVQSGPNYKAVVVNGNQFKITPANSTTPIAYSSSGSGTITCYKIIDRKGGINYADIPDSVVRFGNRLHLVKYQSNGDEYFMEPVNSWFGLEALPQTSNKALYKLKEKQLFYRLPQNVSPSNGTIYIEHYKYVELNDYPFELVDMLIDQLIQTMAPSNQAPPTNKNNGNQ